MVRRRPLLLGSLTAAACGGADPRGTRSGGEGANAGQAPAGRPERRFRFASLAGPVVTHENYRGRMTVILLAATYDAGSQVQARFVESVVRRHTPRINALMVVLEPPQNAPLVEAFAASLALSYDVAFADAATIAGEGPFPGLHHVPSLLLLDRDGREVWRRLGLVERGPLSDTIRAYQ
ncbi:MAG: TlpA family protein disulfide reductase [Myxococcota bacterium]